MPSASSAAGSAAGTEAPERPERSERKSRETKADGGSEAQGAEADASMSNYAFFVKYTYSNECALLAYNFHELVSKLGVFEVFAYRHDHRLISVTLAYILFRYQDTVLRQVMATALQELLDRVKPDMKPQVPKMLESNRRRESAVLRVVLDKYTQKLPLTGVRLKKTCAG
eukprot:g30604.t1